MADGLETGGPDDAAWIEGGSVGAAEDGGELVGEDVVAEDASTEYFAEGRFGRLEVKDVSCSSHQACSCPGQLTYLYAGRSFRRRVGYAILKVGHVNVWGIPSVNTFQMARGRSNPDQPPYAALKTALSSLGTLTAFSSASCPSVPSGFPSVPPQSRSASACTSRMSQRSTCGLRTWILAAALLSPRDVSFGSRPVLMAYARKAWMVSLLLAGERVVGMRMRWDIREREARNSSMRRSPVLRPMPLDRRYR